MQKSALNLLKTARLKEVGATNYRSYGVLNSINRSMLMRVIDQLVYEKYLVVGDYQVLKMGDIRRLKDSATSVMVKITDEDKRPVKTPKVSKKATEKSSLTSSGYKLFEKLRELRLEIAREENMPPYIVFNDKTLIDMSAKVPATKEEMLEVSGVGENKFKKYGDRFLKAIGECCKEYPNLIAKK